MAKSTTHSKLDNTIKSELKNKVILVTGGDGSIGSALVEKILEYPIKSYKIKDLTDKISKNHKIIGLRQGEKLKEILLTDSEKAKSVEKKDMWIICPYLSRK